MKAAEDIVREANKNAITVLKKTGCIYKIIDRFNQTHTNKKVTRPKVHSWVDLDIARKIRAAKPGDSIIFQAKGRPMKNLSSTVSGKASKILGPGKHRVTQNNQDQTITIFLTGADEPTGLDAALLALGGK